MGNVVDLIFTDLLYINIKLEFITTTKWVSGFRVRDVPVI